MSITITSDKDVDLESGIVDGTHIVDGTVQLEIFKTVEDINYYKSQGSIEYPIIDLGPQFIQINSISSIASTPLDTDYTIFTSTSSNLLDFSEFTAIDSLTGEILSPQGRYIKIIVDLGSLGDNVLNLKNDFDNSESSDFESSPYIFFNGSLQLKTSFSLDMIEDIGVSPDGKVFRNTFNKSNFKCINSLELI